MLRYFSLILLVAALALGATPGTAQDDSCRATYIQAVADLMTNCRLVGSGSVCIGAGSAAIQTTSGQTLSDLGSAFPLANVAGVQVENGASWGLARLHVSDPRDGSKYATMIALGPVNVVLTESERRSSGFAFTLTGATESSCSELPRPGVLIQSPELSLTLISVNGIDLAINGTVVLHPLDNGVSISAITHETILGQSGQVIFAGYGADLTSEAEVVITPYDPENVAHLPVEVLPTIERIPVPGSATSTEQLPLHLAPDFATVASNAYIDAGLPISVIGQNPAGDWLYVRTYDLITGWIPRGWVTLDTVGELPSFTSSPPLPTRPYGPVHAIGTTIAEGNNLREGPGESYAIVVRVPLRTQVDIYGRSPDSRWLYVGLADGTRAWVSVDIVHSPTLQSVQELPLTPDFPE